MKTRVVKLSGPRFIPQRWVPHFLWGGHWEGVQEESENSFYCYESFDAQLKNCVVDTDEKADHILFRFQRFMFDKELATK